MPFFSDEVDPAGALSSSGGLDISFVFDGIRVDVAIRFEFGFEATLGCLYCGP